MSRSYRVPMYTDGYKGSKRRQFFKRLANKTVRRSKDVPNGKSYRKFSDSWDICDFKYFYNPKSHIYYWDSVLKVIDPSPVWQVARK